MSIPEKSAGMPIFPIPILVLASPYSLQNEKKSLIPSVSKVRVMLFSYKGYTLSIDYPNSERLD